MISDHIRHSGLNNTNARLSNEQALTSRESLSVSHGIIDVGKDGRHIQSTPLRVDEFGITHVDDHSKSIRIYRNSTAVLAYNLPLHLAPSVTAGDTIHFL